MKHEVLIVEDDPLIFKIEQDLLLKHNCIVESAKTGEEAIQMIAAKEYDFIFMDVDLPDISGLEVTEAVREQEKINQKHVPIIGLTVHTSKKIKQNCLDAGMDSVVTKPLKTMWVKNILAWMANITHARSIPLVFNEKQALSRIGDKSRLTEIIQIFLNESLPEKQAALKQAYQVQEWKTMSAIIHQLQGVCLYCGAERLQWAAKQLNIYLKSTKQDVVQRDSFYHRVMDTLDETVLHLTKWLENNKIL